MANEITEDTGQRIIELFERVLIHLDRDGAEKKAMEDARMSHAKRLKAERDAGQAKLIAERDAAKAAHDKHPEDKNATRPDEQ